MKVKSKYRMLVAGLFLAVCLLFTGAAGISANSFDTIHIYGSSGTSVTLGVNAAYGVSTVEWNPTTKTLTLKSNGVTQTEIMGLRVSNQSTPGATPIDAINLVIDGDVKITDGINFYLEDQAENPISVDLTIKGAGGANGSRLEVSHATEDPLVQYAKGAIGTAGNIAISGLDSFTVQGISPAVNHAKATRPHGIYAYVDGTISIKDCGTVDITGGATPDGVLNTGFEGGCGIFLSAPFQGHVVLDSIKRLNILGGDGGDGAAGVSGKSGGEAVRVNADEGDIAIKNCSEVVSLRGGDGGDGLYSASRPPGLGASAMRCSMDITIENCRGQNSFTGGQTGKWEGPFEGRSGEALMSNEGVILRNNAPITIQGGEGNWDATQQVNVYGGYGVTASRFTVYGGSAKISGGKHGPYNEANYVPTYATAVYVFGEVPAFNVTCTAPGQTLQLNDYDDISYGSEPALMYESYESTQPSTAPESSWKFTNVKITKPANPLYRWVEDQNLSWSYFATISEEYQGVETPSPSIGLLSTVTKPPVPPTYSVTFYDDSAELTKVSNISSGSTLGTAMPSDPQKDGFLFKGWVTRSGTAETAFTKDTEITADTSVYATWIAVADDYERHRSYLQGYEDGTFRPGNDIIRAEVAVVFNRLVEMKGNLSSLSAFSDLSAEEWYDEAIAKAVENGLMYGYPDGTFMPEDSITRAEFAVVVVRFAKIANIEGTVVTEGSFSDVPSDYWALQEIGYAAERGWIDGYPDGTFRPGNPITRAEVVTLVNRVLNRVADADYIEAHGDDLKTYSDLPDDYWAYLDIIEASNEHLFERRDDNTEQWMQ